jgi:hypothetical protein
MRKSKIILRLGIYSENDISVIYSNEIKKILPSPDLMYLKNSERILENGKIMPFKNKETLFQFELSLESFYLEEAHKSFTDFWLPYLDSLKLVNKDYGFCLSLDYEITVYDFHYPSICFPVDYISFLNSIGVQLTLSIYND